MIFKSYECYFFPSITTQLLKLNDYQLYFGSDMNAVINHTLNKSSPVFTSSQSASKALNGFYKRLEFDWCVESA